MFTRLTGENKYCLRTRLCSPFPQKRILTGKNIAWEWLLSLTVIVLIGRSWVWTVLPPSLHMWVLSPHMCELCLCLFACVSFHYLTCVSCVYVFLCEFPLPHMCELCICLLACVSFHHITCVSCVMSLRVPAPSLSYKKKGKNIASRLSLWGELN